MSTTHPAENSTDLAASKARVVRARRTDRGLLVATIDRSIMSLLVGPIKRDLQLTDVQIGFLLGPAFVLFYAFLGLPIARLADRYSRRLIIGIGIAFWSLMTALCGVAHTYRQLFWARVGVGAGESSFGPATFSILTDSFPPRQLPRALAINAIGFTWGTALASIVGGAVIQAIAGMPPVIVPVLGEIRPWQLVFFAVGIPGFALAAVMATVHEPRRRGLIASKLASDGKPQVGPDQGDRGISRQRLEDVRADFRSDGHQDHARRSARDCGHPNFSFGPTDGPRRRSPYSQGIIMLVASPLGLLAGSWLAEWFAKKGL